MSIRVQCSHCGPLLLLALVYCAASPAVILADDEKRADEDAPLALAHMPADCVGLIRFAPARLLASPLVSEGMADLLMTDAPVPIDQLEQAVFWIVTVQGSEPPSLASPDDFFSLTFTEPFDVAETHEALNSIGWTRDIDARTLVCGDPRRLEELSTDSQSRSPLANAIDVEQLDADVFIAFQLVSDAYTVDWSGNEQLLFAMGDLGASLMDLTQVQFALRSGESPLLKTWLEFSDSEIAEGYAALLEEQLPALIASQTENEVFGGLMRELTDAWSVEHSDRIVSFEIAHSNELAAEVAMLFDVAMQPVVLVNPGGRPETRASNNLKNLLLASHNYHEVHDTFPVEVDAAYLDEDGRPYLSWRVHILEFFDEEGQALYKEFHLDEPWDSEHNIELLDRMPALYADPFGEVEDATLTRIVRFDVDADWAPFPSGVGQPLEAFTHDGLSNTIYGIIVGADKAVPWTKPEDLTLDLDEPVAGQLGELSQTFVIVGLVDGAVRRLPLTVDNEVFLNLINPTDGQRIPDVFE